MSTKHNLQMFVTVALLAIAAACSLFQKEVPLTHQVELHIDHDGDSTAPLVILKDLDARTQELVAYEGDIEDIDLAGITVSIKNLAGVDPLHLQGEIAFAETGSKDFTVLGKVGSVCDGAEKGSNTSEIAPGSYASQKLSKLISKGSMITFRLKATAEPFTPDAAVTLTIKSKMTVEI